MFYGGFRSVAGQHQDADCTVIRLGEILGFQVAVITSERCSAFETNGQTPLQYSPGTRHMEPPLATLARDHREVLCRIAADTRLFAGLPRALAPFRSLFLIDVLDRTSLSRGSPLRRRYLRTFGGDVSDGMGDPIKLGERGDGVDIFFRMIGRRNRINLYWGRQVR
jgi:hypothetical protein